METGWGSQLNGNGSDAAFGFCSANVDMICFGFNSMNLVNNPGKQLALIRALLEGAYYKKNWILKKWGLVLAGEIGALRFQNGLEGNPGNPGNNLLKPWKISAWILSLPPLPPSLLRCGARARVRVCCAWVLARVGTVRGCVRERVLAL